MGADRLVARAYGAFLEVPPGAFTLEAKSDEDITSYLFALRTRPLAQVGIKSKLLAYLADECVPQAERFFDLAVEALYGLGTVEALGRCHGNHPETVPSSCGGNCRRATSNITAMLEPFQFALAFEASAGSVQRCPLHIGTGVLHALLAGAVPVFQGPDMTLTVFDRSALILAPPQRPLVEPLDTLRAAARSPEATSQMAATPALQSVAGQYWFSWDRTAFQGERTNLADRALALIAPFLQGSPSRRCAAHARARSPVCQPGVAECSVLA